MNQYSICAPFKHFPVSTVKSTLFPRLTADFGQPLTEKKRAKSVLESPQKTLTLNIIPRRLVTDPSQKHNEFTAVLNDKINAKTHALQQDPT